MNYSAVLNDVDDDGEMGVGEDHLELVSNGDALNHISDGAADGAEDCISLLLLQPHSEFEGGFISLLADLLSDLDGDVLKSSREGAKFALDNNLSRLQVHGDALGDFKLLLSTDKLHSWYGD
jgi:hypothetical protein